MANMFSGHIKKEIPKNMDDCIKPDSVSTNLWIWCERLEKWGKILFWILIVIGIIDTIIACVEAHQFIQEIGAETIEEIREASAEMGIEIPTVFEALVNNLLLWTLYAFLEYCAYHIIALLIGALASIVQNTKISANVALFNTTCNSIDKALSNTTCENNIKTNVADIQNNTSKNIENGNQKIQSIIISKICDNDKCSRCGNSGEVYECEIIKTYGTAHQKLCKECLNKYEQEGYVLIEKNEADNHKWRCSRCGEMINTKICPFCGMKYE